MLAYVTFSLYTTLFGATISIFVYTAEQKENTRNPAHLYNVKKD